MSGDNNEVYEIDKVLTEFGCSAEELKHMSIKEKGVLISTFRLSMTESREKVAMPVSTPTLQVDELQQRFKKTGVSLTPLIAKSVVDDDSDEVVVLNELESPRCSSLKRPPIHSSPGNRSPAVRNHHRTPTSTVTPTVSSGTTVSARKALVELVEKQVVSPVTPTPKSKVTPTVSSGAIVKARKALVEPVKKQVGSPVISTPTSKVTPAVSSGTAVRARKKIELEEPVEEQIVSPATSEDIEQLEVIPFPDYGQQRAEIYKLNPHSCVDTALSTLAETSLFPKRKNKSVSFFRSEHALSLKMDDYIALCLRKFGFSPVQVVPAKYDDGKETVNDTPKMIDLAGAYDDHFDIPPFLEESTSNPKYNLRQRTTTKRTADDYKFDISDDDDSDSIIPNKKIYRSEKDKIFSPREETKPSIAKTRINKLSSAVGKIAAEQKVNDELVTVDSDTSSDSDVPGKEVCVPQLQYSSVVANDTNKWKMSKTKVSALPKGQSVMDSEGEMKSVKRRQAKPSDVLKPAPISGKNRRAVLAEGSFSQKPARGKQANKKESESDTDKVQGEQMPELISCPLCKEEFPEPEIQAHVNECCDQTASQSLEGQCPVCFQNFPHDELPDHSSSCEGESKNLAMDQN